MKYILTLVAQSVAHWLPGYPLAILSAVRKPVIKSFPWTVEGLRRQRIVPHEHFIETSDIYPFSLTST